MLEVPITIFADCHDATQLKLNLQYFTRMVPAILQDKLHIMQYNVRDLIETSYRREPGRAYQEFCRAFVPALEITCMYHSCHRVPYIFSDSVIDRMIIQDTSTVEAKELMFKSYTTMGNPLFANLLYPNSFHAKGVFIDGEPLVVDLDPTDFNLSVSTKSTLAKEVLHRRGGAGRWVHGGRNYTVVDTNVESPVQILGGMPVDALAGRRNSVPGIQVIHKRDRGARSYKFTRYENPDVKNLARNGNKIPPIVGSMKDKHVGHFDPTKVMLYEHLNEVSRYPEAFHGRTTLYTLWVLSHMYKAVQDAFLKHPMSKNGVALIPTLWFEMGLKDLVTTEEPRVEDIVGKIRTLLENAFDQRAQYLVNRGLFTEATIHLDVPWWNKVAFTERVSQEELQYVPTLVEGSNNDSSFTLRPKSRLVFSIERGNSMYRGGRVENFDEDGNVINTDVYDPHARWGASDHMSTYYREQTTNLYSNTGDLRIANRSEVGSITSPRGILVRALMALNAQGLEDELKDKVFGVNLLLSLPRHIGMVVHRSYVYYSHGLTLEVHLMNPMMDVLGDGKNGFVVVHSISHNSSRLFYF